LFIEEHIERILGKLLLCGYKCEFRLQWLLNDHKPHAFDFKQMPSILPDCLLIIGKKLMLIKVSNFNLVDFCSGWDKMFCQCKTGDVYVD